MDVPHKVKQRVTMEISYKQDDLLMGAVRRWEHCQKYLGVVKCSAGLQALQARLGMFSTPNGKESK